VVVSCSLLMSCKTSSQLEQSKQDFSQGLYRDQNGTDTTTIASLSWKEFFTDTLLQSYIQEAVDNNFDLKIAAARIDAARSSFRQSKAALFPSLEADADGTWSKQGKSSFDDTYSLSLNASWEADIWGKLRSTKRAELNALLESEAYKRSVQTQLVADVSTYYYTLLAYHQELDILIATEKSYGEDVTTMKKLKESDVVTGADVVQSEANHYSAKVSISELKQSIRETENALCLLLAREPGEIECGSMDTQQINQELKIGVPAQLLANRPDVKEAEFALRYYSEMTNVARAYFYPSLTITAEAGYSKTELADFFNPSSFFSNLVAGLAAPIFNNRANKQRLETAKAQQEEYFQTYKQTVLTAGVEVSNALYAFQIASEKKENRSLQIGSLEKAVDYTKKLLQYTSSTNYTDVLTSEQSLLNAERNLVTDKLDQLTSMIELYRSLGGGVN